MNTNDVKVWKDLLDELKEISEQNRVILNEIKEEIELQKQRNKAEILALSAEVSNQASALEGLLRELDAENLFGLPSDQTTLNSFKSTLQAQLEKTKQLVSYSRSLLDSQTTSQSTIEKIKIGTRRSRERSQNYLPKLFRSEYLLGNWIIHHDNDSFTCQSFWDDASFKEYDFKGQELTEEREGTYEVGNGQLHMVFSDGTVKDCTVSGFTDQSIDYIIDGKPVQYDYMPENLLNDFLDGQAPKNA
ncbi:MAG: hypothetical protein HUJ54_09650 [Erysipelotrichaceae bacterium]|nr:hypothetical protein [Erysipelotrichaceae bacterium]